VSGGIGEYPGIYVRLGDPEVFRFLASVLFPGTMLTTPHAHGKRL
jgi:hypothetical protein